MAISAKNSLQKRTQPFDFDSLREIAKNQIESLYTRKQQYLEKNDLYLKEIKKVFLHELNCRKRKEGLI